MAAKEVSSGSTLPAPKAITPVQKEQEDKNRAPSVKLSSGNGARALSENEAAQSTTPTIEQIISVDGEDIDTNNEEKMVRFLNIHLIAVVFTVCAIDAWMF